ncbi:MAG: class I SAM-dependent methyltransferase [Elusimicrobiota bacterium]|nr:class I SAM-dependent methyltransferase [Elusimicrobiota bacterium]
MANCLICGGGDVKTIKTKVSGFLTERMFSGVEKKTDLIHCKTCGFAYYSLRPAAAELANFYKGYRDSFYQKQRQKHDIWYTAEMNAAIGKTPVEIQNRRVNLERIIKRHLRAREIKTVLDYGGDKGQHIPDIFAAAQKFVYDLSGVAPVKGVKSLSAAELEHKKFDFVMCSHMLEHAPDPKREISSVIKHLAPDAALYVELPFDSPFSPCRWTDRVRFVIKNPAQGLHFAWRRFLNIKKESGAFCPMHEHINYFTPASAAKLLQEQGLAIIYKDSSNIDFGWIKSKVISVIARVK